MLTAKSALVALLLSFMTVWSPAIGQDARMTMLVSGNDLYERCQTDQADPTYLANVGFCHGYIYAAADFFATIADEAGRPSCRKAGVDNRQLIDTVVKYLRDHPEKRHQPGNYAVIAVIAPLMSECSK